MDSLQYLESLTGENITDLVGGGGVGGFIVLKTGKGLNKRRLRTNVGRPFQAHAIVVSNKITP